MNLPRIIHELFYNYLLTINNVQSLSGLSNLAALQVVDLIMHYAL